MEELNLNLDKLILGSNPLYGVDHFSSQRAREKARGMTSDKIISVLKASFSSGATGFNFSPHPAIYANLGRLKEEGYGARVGLYPMLPDTQSYITAQLKSGTTGMIRHLFTDLGLSTGTHALIEGTLSWLTSDPTRALKLYLDVEVKRLAEIAPRNFEIRVVLAHEMLTDLALALELDQMVKTYVEYLHDKYKIEAGFVTRNFPRFVEFCDNL